MIKFRTLLAQFEKKTLKIKGMLRENKFGDLVFLLNFVHVLCMNINCAKFDRNLDSTSFQGNYFKADPLFVLNTL